MQYPDLDLALQRAKAEVDRQFSPEAVEAARLRLLAELEELFKQKEEALKALEHLGPDILFKGILPFRTKVIEMREHDDLEMRWRSYMLKFSSERGPEWRLPPGFWRLLILAVPVDPKTERLSAWDKAGTSLNK